MAARILVIEDNAANLELARYLLSYGGYTVLEARDGAQGVDVALRERPDLIVCDLQMPLLDGYQALALLREHPECAGMAVVAVTAFSMPNDRQKVMTAGFNGYLSKPIEPENFVAQIEAFLPAALRASPRSAPGA
ncbi:response regulator [Pelomonas sp. Root1444]|jgi:two-component system cell cycle response regulator DivK|uniref:response regulator n=1 Tax=Pelomonas sp. Root1444 TaxID=1736464 RepID=UPI000702BC3E|nr:response regulator [Pelomonas sp. Root1444]KQY85437.1 two-component system response regulator [Pelomonas sp. Root1444]